MADRQTRVMYAGDDGWYKMYDPEFTQRCKRRIRMAAHNDQDSNLVRIVVEGVKTVYGSEISAKLERRIDLQQYYPARLRVDTQSADGLIFLAESVCNDIKKKGFAQILIEGARIIYGPEKSDQVRTEFKQQQNNCSHYRNGSTSDDYGLFRIIERVCFDVDVSLFQTEVQPENATIKVQPIYSINRIPIINYLSDMNTKSKIIHYRK